MKLKISEVCSLLGVDGIRGDITTNRAARAFVALEGRPEATMEDVARVIALCVNHRHAPLSIASSKADGDIRLFYRPHRTLCSVPQ